MSQHPLAQLAEIVREVRHLENERAREGDKGRWNRRQGARLAELLDRFELMVERWVPDAEQREAWRQAAHHEGELPDVAIPALPPPLYVGRAEDGARLEIRKDDDGRLQIKVGKDVVRRDATGMPRATGPVEVEGRPYPEVAEVPDEALDALRTWAANGRSAPPWEWAGPLYEDGLVDEHLSLTARGERLLQLTGGKVRPPEPLPEKWQP